MGKNDISGVVELSRRVIVERYPDETKLEQLQSNNVDRYESLLYLMDYENKHSDSISIKNYMKILKDENQNIVGLLRGRFFKEKQYFLVDWMCKDYGAKTRGVSRILLKAVVENIKNDGFTLKTIKATTRQSLHDAVKCYKKLGLKMIFEEKGRIEFKGEIRNPPPTVIKKRIK